MTTPKDRRMTAMVTPKPPARMLSTSDTQARRAIERFRGGHTGPNARLSDDQVNQIWSSLPEDVRADYLRRLEAPAASETLSVRPAADSEQPSNPATDD